MSDKIPFPTDGDADKSQHDEAEKSANTDIFDATFDSLMNIFGASCEEHGIENAIVIVRDPNEGTKTPHVFFRGGILESAEMLAEVLRSIKYSIIEKLQT